MADIFVTVRIPDGQECRDERRCIFTKYSKGHGGYNCALYGRLLAGGDNPVKCRPCKLYCERYRDDPEGVDE